MRRLVKALPAVALALTLIAAGCGSSSSGSQSTAAAPSPAPPTAPAPTPTNPPAEIKASGEQVADDLEASRFESACEGFTQSAHEKLAHLPGGCAGVLELGHVAGGAKGRKFADLFRHALATRLPRFQIRGEEAFYKGNLEARYEEGRWRFEATGNLFSRAA